jgi:hypothetical protein
MTLTIAESEESTDSFIVVPNMVDQFGRVRISAEIFASSMAPRYSKNANIWQSLSKTKNRTESSTIQILMKRSFLRLFHHQNGLVPAIVAAGKSCRIRKM